MKKDYLMIGLLALCCMCFVSCGGSKSDSQEASETVSDDKGVLADLIDVYIEMSELKHEMEERYSKNDLSDEEKQEMIVKLQECEKKAQEMGPTYKGKAFKFEASDATGVTFSDGVIASVNSSRVLQVNFSAKPSSEMSDPIYAYFLDAKNNLVFKTLGFVQKSDGRISISLRTAVGGMRKTTPVEVWKSIATIAKIMVVSKEEYDAGVIPTPGKGDAPKAEAQPACKFMMTDNGVDKITIGADINKLPKAIEGLYDKVVVESDYNAMEDETITTATFTLKGKEVMTAMGDDNKKVCYINVQVPGVAVKIGDAYFQVGSLIKDLLKANGVKKDDSYAAVYGKVQFDGDVNNKICNISVGSAW